MVCCVAYVAYAYVKVTGILRCAMPMTGDKSNGEGSLQFNVISHT